MGKGYSLPLAGQCINDGNDSGLYFMKTVNMHVVWSSPTCSAQTDGGFFACGSSPFFTPPKPYTEPYPINYVPPSGSTSYGFIYGISENVPVTLTGLNGDPLYFSAGDLAPWLPKTYCPPPYNVYNRAGPAYTNCHCYGAMTRRPANNNNYANRANYDFIDGFEVPYADYNAKICGECKTKNWLIFSNPAQPLYTTVDEPFLISTHFEQSGSAAPSDSANGGNLYVPFCAPMNVRKEDGTIVGQYTGLAVSAVFGMASLAYGFANPYLPPNEWSPNPPPKPKVDSHRAFYSLELSTYFRGTSTDSSYVVGSPLLSRQRYWLYSGPNTGNWRYPFRIMFQTTLYATNPTTIRLNVLGGTTQDLTLNNTNQKILVTY